MRTVVIAVAFVATLAVVATVIYAGQMWWTWVEAPQRLNMASATARAYGESVGSAGSAAACIGAAMTAGSRHKVSNVMLSCLDAADSRELCVEPSYQPDYELQQARIARFCQRLGEQSTEPCITVAASVDLWCHLDEVKRSRTPAAPP